MVFWFSFINLLINACLFSRLQMSSMTSLNPMSSAHHQHLGTHHHSASAGLSPSPLGSSPLSSSHHLVSSLSSSSLNGGSHTLPHSSLSHTPLTHGSPRSPSGGPASLTPLPQDCLDSYPDDKSAVAAHNSAAASAAAAWKNYQGFQSLWRRESEDPIAHYNSHHDMSM